jgi:hypothetical protein
MLKPDAQPHVKQQNTAAQTLNERLCCFEIGNVKLSGGSGEVPTAHLTPASHHKQGIVPHNQTQQQQQQQQQIYIRYEAALAAA